MSDYFAQSDPMSAMPIAEEEAMGTTHHLEDVSDDIFPVAEYVDTGADVYPDWEWYRATFPSEWIVRSSPRVGLSAGCPICDRNGTILPQAENFFEDIHPVAPYNSVYNDGGGYFIPFLGHRDFLGAIEHVNQMPEIHLGANLPDDREWIDCYVWSHGSLYPIFALGNGRIVYQAGVPRRELTLEEWESDAAEVLDRDVPLEELYREYIVQDPMETARMFSPIDLGLH